MRRVLATGMLVALSACEPGLVPCVAPPHVPGGVMVDVQEVTYDVTGHSAGALDGSLRAEGPSHEGEHVWALTRWRVRWSGRPEPHDGGCRMADPRVAVNVEITIPEWGGRASAPAALGAQWDRFVTSLRRHEYGHRDRAILAGEAALMAVGGTSATDCDALPALVDAQVVAVVRRHRDLDAAYDRNTLCGRTEGVAWPPIDDR